MPGPKMGPRPDDFDERIVRQSPTFQKWEALAVGARLRYACRDFLKGQEDDEERLMRRIMIARRNNLRDHDALKRARAVVTTMTVQAAPAAAAACDVDDDAHHHDSCSPDDADQQQEQSTLPAVNVDKEEGGNDNDNADDNDVDKSDNKSNQKPKRRKVNYSAFDEQVGQEMDVAAVEATRSYRTWLALEDGAEFIYNQKYTKGRPIHDWLLRKNIWRRMRYRRENKKMVQAVLATHGLTTAPSVIVAFSSVSADDCGDHDGGAGHGGDDGQGGVGAGLVDDALLASAAAAVDKVQHIHKSVVDAAVAAAESYVKSNVDNEHVSV